MPLFPFFRPLDTNLVPIERDSPDYTAAHFTHFTDAALDHQFQTTAVEPNLQDRLRRDPRMREGLLRLITELRDDIRQSISIAEARQQPPPSLGSFPSPLDSLSAPSDLLRDASVWSTEGDDRTILIDKTPHNNDGLLVNAAAATTTTGSIKQLSVEQQTAVTTTSEIRRSPGLPVNVVRYCSYDGCIDKIRAAAEDITRLQGIEMWDESVLESKGELMRVTTTDPDKLRQRLHKARHKKIDLLFPSNEVKNKTVVKHQITGAPVGKNANVGAVYQQQQAPPPAMVHVMELEKLQFADALANCSTNCLSGAVGCEELLTGRCLSPAYTDIADALGNMFSALEMYNMSFATALMAHFVPKTAVLEDGSWSEVSVNHEQKLDHGGGMKGRSKAVVVPHKHVSIFISKSKDDALCNNNRVAGESVYGERCVSVQTRMGQRLSTRC
jgi:hypothetical protein